MPRWENDSLELNYAIRHMLEAEKLFDPDAQMWIEKHRAFSAAMEKLVVSNRPARWRIFAHMQLESNRRWVRKFADSGLMPPSYLLKACGIPRAEVIAIYLLVIGKPPPDNI